MSFFDNLFSKSRKPVPIESIHDELIFIKRLLAQSLSKMYLQERFDIQELNLKSETMDEMIYQGSYGFFLLKFNEDSEIYEFTYTDHSGKSHVLVDGDHNQYGRLTFRRDDLPPENISSS